MVANVISRTRPRSNESAKNNLERTRKHRAANRAGNRQANCGSDCHGAYPDARSDAVLRTSYRAFAAAPKNQYWPIRIDGPVILHFLQTARSCRNHLAMELSLGDPA